MAEEIHLISDTQMLKHLTDNCKMVLKILTDEIMKITGLFELSRNTYSSCGRV